MATEAAAQEWIAVSDEESCVEEEEEEGSSQHAAGWCGTAGQSKPINTEYVQQLHMSSYLFATKVLGK